MSKLPIKKILEKFDKLKKANILRYKTYVAKKAT